MKKILAASAAALALAAFAAPASASSFVGSYLGFDVGYGGGQANSESYGPIGSSLPLTQADANVDGAILGAHIGHNWAGGSTWIYGLEAEFRYQGMDGDDGGSGGDINELSTDWEGSLQAHIGTMINPTTMFYVLAGWSFLGADSNVLNAPLETVSETYSGWTAGAGVAFELSPTSNLRLQYRYTDYGSETLTFPVNNYDMETGPAIHELTLGLSWTF